MKIVKPAEEGANDFPENEVCAYYIDPKLTCIYCLHANKVFVILCLSDFS